MKTFSQLIVFSALLVAGAANSAAQPVGAPMTANLEPVRVRKQVLPLFPQELIQAGRREGKVRVAFSIGTDGKIEDCLAVAYTHPAFAEATVAALRRWVFEPARLRGEPVASATEINVEFEVQGTTVVSLTASEAIMAYFRGMERESTSYAPRSLRELDRIPTPLAAPPPAYPQALADKGRRGTVRVTFYIDETGAVRLPCVEMGEDGDLAMLAIEALQKWKFEPPMCQGQPVLVRASQVFNFQSAKVAAKRS